MPNLTDDYLPEQFTVSQLDANSLCIEQRRLSYSGLNIFMLFFSTVWLGGTGVLLGRYLGSGVDAEGRSIPLLLVLLFVAISLWLIGTTLFFFFGKTTFLLGAEGLRLESTLLGVRLRSVEVAQTAIRRLVQVQDGGHEDSFPTWGLRVETEADMVKLIVRQPHEVSDWLGGVIAEWAGVRFFAAEADD